MRGPATNFIYSLQFKGLDRSRRRFPSVLHDRAPAKRATAPAPHCRRALRIAAGFQQRPCARSAQFRTGLVDQPGSNWALANHCFRAFFQAATPETRKRCRRQAVGTVPPSITYSTHVMEAARAEAKNAMRSAASLGLAGRPSGIPPRPAMRRVPGIEPDPCSSSKQNFVDYAVCDGSQFS